MKGTAEARRAGRRFVRSAHGLSRPRRRATSVFSIEHNHPHRVVELAREQITYDALSESIVVVDLDPVVTKAAKVIHDQMDALFVALRRERWGRTRTQLYALWTTEANIAQERESNRYGFSANDPAFRLLRRSPRRRPSRKTRDNYPRHPGEAGDIRERQRSDNCRTDCESECKNLIDLHIGGRRLRTGILRPFQSIDGFVAPLGALPRDELCDFENTVATHVNAGRPSNHVLNLMLRSAANLAMDLPRHGQACQHRPRMRRM